MLQGRSGRTCSLCDLLPDTVQPSTLWCLRQPSAICKLICGNLWKEVLLIASCCKDAKGGRCLMDNFPSAAFLEGVDPNAHVRAVADSQLQRSSWSVPLQADMLDRIKAFLRGKLDPDGCSEAERADAQKLICALTSWTRALREPVRSQKLANQTQYSIRQMWHAFMTSRFLRGTAFHKALEHVCGAQWPGLFASVIESGHAGGPSPSTLRRSQFLVDMGLLLSAQSRNAGQGLAAKARETLAPETLRWGWSDASPLGGSNWLISKTHFHLNQVSASGFHSRHPSCT